jgi:hypothetical protein
MHGAVSCCIFSVLFFFLQSQSKLGAGSKSIRQDFQLSIQALEKLVLKVETTELYEPRYRYRGI